MRSGMAPMVIVEATVYKGRHPQTGTIVALPPEDHIEGLERMRSAGKALPGIELAILDPDGNLPPPCGC